jgi:DNA-binding response OmpR family regulator
MKSEKVLYIEREKFLRSMLEIAFKNKSKEIYTIDTLENNLYLIDDLKPAIILFDVKTVRENLENLFNLNDRFVLIATGDEQDKELVVNRVKRFIIKPIVANKIVENILSTL